MLLREKHILTKLQKGNESGFRDLFDLYYQPLCIFALKYIDSIEEAEDLVQDTFIRFWNNKSFENINTGLKSYLFQAVKNNSLNHLRKNSKYRFEKIDSEVLNIVQDELNSDELNELSSNLIKQINELPEKARNVFKAIVFDNMKYKEVAELNGISVNTVKTHYSRSLAKVRKTLDIVVFVLLH